MPPAPSGASDDPAAWYASATATTRRKLYVIDIAHTIHGWRDGWSFTRGMGFRVRRSAGGRGPSCRATASRRSRSCPRTPWTWRSRIRRTCSRTAGPRAAADRKSTRLNSSHITISYAVFCLKKKKKNKKKTKKKKKKKQRQN